MVTDCLPREGICGTGIIGGREDEFSAGAEEAPAGLNPPIKPGLA
jgi:hypothetical protein